MTDQELLDALRKRQDEGVHPCKNLLHFTPIGGGHCRECRLATARAKSERYYARNKERRLQRQREARIGW